tara:strand:- start:299 stop:787 length:489 start_codon:yes stop_codon:yes gene_type:complete
VGDLGRYFDLSEFTRSSAAAREGLDNTPTPEALDALRGLVAMVLDPLREEEGPVRITSGYRAPAVNAAIGGSSTSQHMKGEAADLKLVNHHDAERVAALLAAMELPVDQCIWYEPEVGGHVHVSFAQDGQQRGQFLRCYKEGSRKRYATYIQSTPRSCKFTG